MRNFFAFLPAVALTIALAPASAAETAAPPPTEPVAVAKPENRLETLYGELKRQRNEKAAERIASRIFEEWNHSGSASIDLMMLWSQKAIEAEKFDVALDFLDQVVTLSPDFAEGWNRRATVHFMMRSFGKSMADIDRTLQLEPRHFGALAGMAQIMKERGSKELALEAYQRVLDIYPMMRSAQNEVATLSEELAGEGI
ncbi:tetratricopeptide repeat protein [Mesorhizobium sp. AaZ16]|jgi:tetratricopeptide (TPR) repeat protein|uniref:tetratricopeptide repeat protein n=1 Tax=Mesorhizobium sp. AaZ16 TaxID=3402289 RepID=UPI00374E8CE7